MIKKKSDVAKRIWEIDILRGTLVIMMVILHILFDLEFVYNFPIGYGTGFIDIIRIIVATLFIMVSGISTSFSKNSFRRGLVVFSAALLISLVTFIVGRDFFICFGVLHLIGICMMASPLLKKIPTFGLIILSLIVGMTQFIIPYIKISHNYFFMFGLYNDKFISADYYPIFPWAWPFLLGMVLSRFIYKEKKSILKFSVRDNPVSWLGRHSLLIYLIHQPIILLLLAIIMGLLA
ncbi:MAG TPA: heparan-alpha-glucosaminide N-acetyltransferase [Acetivibrio sp.]|uniref:heparan-alpha-glucosaminide N-acetyltransferase n=1 Tax=Acetivibrio sp. TaxID=1872092 RepID=UPI002CB3E28A|nr:heparan-alpha-glucosaminide N-acetyltransferase [Acetivibrio sp.]HOM01506.1 heparan-alpha-glucosaminide N-acetyltransferase [Acetivibrio sp.]